MSADRAKRRYFAIVATRLAGAAGAVFGLLIAARAHHTIDQVIGIALVLASLYMIAVVPRALAHRWRTDAE